jgi:phage terminase large subunit-like protein
VIAEQAQQSVLSAPPVAAGYEDLAAAQLVLDFMGELILTKSTPSGRPEKMVVLPHAEKLVRQLFGQRRADGTRQFRKVYWSMARKNAKTQYAAAISLVMLILDQEMSPEVYMAAKTREQASICFDAARDMVLASPDLSSICRIYNATKTITCTLNNGVLKALSRDGGAKHGSNPSAVIVDELHAWTDREMWAALTSGQGARRQPLRLAITTAGFEDAELWRTEYEYAQAVATGAVVDPSYLALIHEAEESDDWRSPETWRKANPGLGITVREEELAEEVRRAEADPAALNDFLRLRCNMRTSQETRAIDPSRWDACAGEPVPLSDTSMEWYAGLDLSMTTDLTALVLAGERDGKVSVHAWFWMPSKKLRDHERTDRFPYSAHKQTGNLNLIEGDTIRPREVIAFIDELSGRVNIKRLTYDRWGLADPDSDLKALGFECAAIGQSCSMLNAPTKKVLEYVAAGVLRHGANPILAFNAASSQLGRDSEGNVKFSKSGPREGFRRIDGMTALAFAVDGLMRAVATTSIFDLMYQ